MTGYQHFGFSYTARICVDIESAGFLVYKLLLYGVALAFETVREPIADFFLVVCYRFDLC